MLSVGFLGTRDPEECVSFPETCLCQVSPRMFVFDSSMSDEVDAALARLLEDDAPDLSVTTFKPLAQSRERY